MNPKKKKNERKKKVIAIRFTKVNTKRDYLYDSGKQQRNSSVYGKKK